MVGNKSRWGLKVRVWVERDGRKVLGPGRVELLGHIDRLRSITAAAKQMGMSYRRAWELVFARFEVLRTSVVWDGVPEPLAVVSRSVPLPLEVLDFSGQRDGASLYQCGTAGGSRAATAPRGAMMTTPWGWRTPICARIRYNLVVFP